MHSVTGYLKFLRPSAAPPLYTASVGGADAKLTLEGEYEEHEVRIQNGRMHQETGAEFSLDREGFIFLQHQSLVQDLYDDTQIKAIYEGELERLIVRATGAQKVVVFDHTLRSDDPEVRRQRQTREPASVVHNDYTDRSARVRLGELLPSESGRAKRFAIINVWRPVNHTAITTPLTVCDGGTVDDNDLVPTVRQARDRVGELMLVRYNPGQRWFYFPNMQEDEVILLKTFDSASDGRARFSIHTAFEDPTAPDDAPPRESIESRSFVFF